MRARRNTQTLILIAGILLTYLLIELPRRVFMPFRKTIRSLKALERGEMEAPLPYIDSSDEVGEVSRAIQSAIQRLRDYNTLRMEKIVEVQRDLTRIIEEVTEGIFILAHNGVILQMNHAAKTMFGIEKDAVPTSIKDIPMLGERVFPNLADIDKQGKQEIHFKINRKGQRRKTAQIIPNIDLNNRLMHVLIIVS
jgi:nitrogen fixation/metabolism regulation signal transduction histidine kinase